MTDPMAHETFMRWFAQRQDERENEGHWPFNILLTISCTVGPAHVKVKVMRAIHDKIMECPLLSFGGGGHVPPVEYALRWETDGTTPTFCTFTPFNHGTFVPTIRRWMQRIQDSIEEEVRVNWILSEPIGSGFESIE